MAEIHSRTLRKIGRYRHLTGWLIFLGSLLGAAAVAVAVYYYGGTSYQATTAVLFPAAGGAAPAPPVLAEEAGGVAGGEPAAAPGGLVGTDKFQLLLESRSLQDTLIRRYDLQKRLGLDLGLTRETLARMLKFTAVPGTGLTVVTTVRGCRAPVPGAWYIPALDREAARVLAAELANGCLEELKAQITEINTNDAQAAYDFLRQNTLQARDRLREVEMRLENLQSREHFLDPQGKAAQVTERIKAVESGRDTSRAREQELARSLGVARSKLEKADALAVSTEVETRNPVIGTLEQKLADLRLSRATALAQGKTEQHRDVVLLTAEIAEAERQLAELENEVLKEVAKSANPEYTDLLRSVTSQEIELAGVRARERAYARLLTSANEALAALPPLSRQYASLARERETLTGLTADLERRLEEAALRTKGAARDPFYVLDKAVPPEYGEGPYVGRAAVIAFLVLFALLWLITAIRRGMLDFFRL